METCDGIDGLGLMDFMKYQYSYYIMMEVFSIL